jgi:hypothetical protein
MPAATGVLAVTALSIGGRSRRLWLVHERVTIDVHASLALGVVAAIALRLRGSVLGRQFTR